MAVKDAFIIVEGPQDAECIARLLDSAGYGRITRIENLPSVYRNLFSPSFPREGLGLDQPHEVPHFRRNAEGCIVAMIPAGGDSKLASSLMAGIEAFKRAPDAIGFLLDDDREPSPTIRHGKLLASVKESEALRSLQFPAAPGAVHAGPPRTGVFVMPDNQQPGTLEMVLLEAGSVAYDLQLRAAQQFVEQFPADGLIAGDLAEGGKPSGKKKQIIGCVAAMLKPGRTLQTSLHDNRWLTGDALDKPLVLELRRWLHPLLDIPAP